MSDLPAYGYLLGSVQTFLMHSMSDMPPETWWLPALVVVVLGAAAAVDSFTATVPDPLIFLGLLAVTSMQGFYVSWPFAARHLGLALAAAFVLWAINEVWYRMFKKDAIGMGDAKWTMLAVSCFDLVPAVFAWGVGACVALFYIGALRLFRHRLERVYFAPFLFFGLLAGIYWLREKSAM